MKLYQFPLSPNCQKVVALAYEVGVPLETTTVDLFNFNRLHFLRRPLEGAVFQFPEKAHLVFRSEKLARDMLLAESVTRGDFKVDGGEIVKHRDGGWS